MKKLVTLFIIGFVFLAANTASAYTSAMKREMIDNWRNAQLAIKLHNYAESIKYLKRLYHEVPENVQGQVAENISVSYLNMHQMKKAFKWMKIAANAGEIQSEFNVSHMYFLLKDYKNSMKWVKRVMENKADNDAVHAAALYSMGVFYHRGYGVEANMDTAIEWYRKAAEAGSLRGMTDLAVELQKRKHCGEAKMWLEKAAASHDPKYVFNLAIFLTDNTTCACGKNGDKAIKLLKEAAKHLLPARMRLGEVYFLGACGVEQSYPKAAKWFYITGVSAVKTHNKAAAKQALSRLMLVRVETKTKIKNLDKAITKLNALISKIS